MALTAKSFVTTKVNRHLQPDFEPPSPRPPTQPPSMDRFYSILFSIHRHVFAKLRLSDFHKFEYNHSSDKCRKGYIGEGGSKPGKNDGLKMQLRQASRSAPPLSPFLWSLSCMGCKKVTPAHV